MHLGNGIICPVTGVPMIVAMAGVGFYAFKAAKKDFTKDKILLSGALTALVFALQMINFAIPQTGSSGHIIGGVLLAALLGPYVGFLAMCSILIIQALFFFDGGLLALGCNIFNMGFLACFVVYPFIFKPLEEKNKPVLGAFLASVVALQLGSIAAVIEGALSGSIAFFGLLNFTGLMQGIHLPIGLVEGVVSGGILAGARFMSPKVASGLFGGVSLVLAGIISKYASKNPDGLEWSLLNISDAVTEQTQGVLYRLAEAFQAQTAIFSNLDFGWLAGLLAAGAVMYFACVLLNLKTAKENAK